MSDKSQSSAVVIKNQTVNPQDEFFHPVGDDSSWSESYYFYYFDPEKEIGGITRMGFRANNGWKDYMHIVFLENGRIVFCYEREDMDRDDTELRTGALSLERGQPFQDWKLKFDGKGQDLEDGRILVTPKKDRPEGWLKLGKVDMDIHFDCVADPHYMFDEASAGSRGHFEQLTAFNGHITVDGERREVKGHGIRDKSWGPRPWTNPTKKKENKAKAPTVNLFTQWITAAISPDLAFAMTFFRGSDGSPRTSGFIYKDGKYHQMLSGSVESDFEDDGLIHKANRFTATFENGYTLKGEGEIINMGPSKVPMPGGATLVNSGLTRFTLDSGETGLGSSEYWTSVTR